MQPDREWLGAAIGRNADKYLARFERMEGKGARRPSWHWPAFFCSTGWFFHRGLARYAFLDALLFGVGFSALVTDRGGLPLRALGVAIVLVLFALVPMYANQLYYARLKKRFAAAARIEPRPTPKAPGKWSIVGSAFGAAFVIYVFLGLGVLFIARPQADFPVRARVTEIVNAAAVCKSSVMEFYEANRRLPASAAEAQCSSLGTANSAPPIVVNGVVRVSAAGRLRNQLESLESGIEFRYTPVCEGGRCDGKPITRWECKAGTTVERIYLPAACR